VDVFVQKRFNSFFDFGHSQRRVMSFSTFLDLIQYGEQEVILNNNGNADSGSRGWTDPVDAARCYSTEGTNMYYLNLQQGRELYQAPLNGMRSDIQPQPMFLPKERSLHAVNMWIGHATSPNTSSSSLHYDRFDNFYVVVQGSKTFTLIPPSEVDNVYISGNTHSVSETGLHQVGKHSFSFGSQSGHFSSVNPVMYEQNPQYAALYPKYALAKKIQVTLQEGEALFIPGGWLHAVTSYDQHIAINYWW
jgi:hypothetical protein